jgi:hypothetical protein
MEDRPENPDLPILLRKAYLTWNEVDGLFFHHAYKRNAHSRNYKWTESLKNARKGVRGLFEEALLNGELKGESSTRANIPIYQKIKKRELCAWLMGKRILDLLEDKGIEVPTENVKFIEEAAKEKPQAELKSAEQEKGFFLRASGWDEVGFVLSGDGVTINVRGAARTLTIEELKKIIPNEKPRDFLLRVIHAHGVFNPDNIEGSAKNNLKAYVSTLRDTLKKLFEINTNPIEPTGSGGYQTMFSTSSRVTPNLSGNPSHKR